LFIAKTSFGQKILSDKQVVFEKKSQISLYNPYEILERFTPSETEIKIADDILTKSLNDNKLTLDTYFRQYVGLIQNNEKIIYINASCQKTEYFETNTLYPKGGGNCYFQCFVNINKKETEKLSFNAPK
jgi:hypothetical protein